MKHLVHRWRTWLAIALAILLLAVAGTAVAFWAPDQPVSALKARWAPPPSQFVALEGMEFHLRDEGPRTDPVPVVLLHGTSASLHTWEGWAAGLRGQRRVITFDLPGFGLTGPAPDADYRLEAHVRHVLAVLDHLGVERCVLGGNSLGGAIAWAVAAQHPERVERLVLVDAAGYPVPSTSVPIGFRLARSPVLAPLMNNLLPRGMVESSVRNVFGQPERVTPELVDRYFAMAVRAGNRKALIQRMSLPRWAADVSVLKTLRQPTLILWGARDRLIPLAAGERFDADIPDSRLVVFDDLGHVPQEEDAARTLAPVLEFLAQPLAAGAMPSGSMPPGADSTAR
jgi:pimeloyl-ACP methyl ester carboxylesterase